MEKIANQLNLLAARLNLIDQTAEPDPYILTPDEEQAAIKNALEQAKNHYQWKMLQMGKPLLKIIDEILNSKDWNKDIDQDQVLQVANSNKHRVEWERQQREKEREQKENDWKIIKELWTARTMFKTLAYHSEHLYNKKLIVNEGNREFITALCYFVSRDPRLETDLGFSLNKGLLIRGVSGVGKTHLVKCIADNPVLPIRIESMIDITETIKREQDYELQPFKCLYLDDVGTEELDSKTYGSKITFFKNFIELQYLNTTVFNNLIISTNCSHAVLESRYGFRVRSRIKDMFNVIDVKGQDMRGV